jgi:hypothetical protein
MTIRLTTISVGLLVILASARICPAVEIPAVHAGITLDNGQLVYTAPDGARVPLQARTDNHTLEKYRSLPVGTDTGIRFDFQAPQLEGKLYYGLINDPATVKHAYPVFFNRSATITGGKAQIDIKSRMTGKYDFVGWQSSGSMRLGYRIVTDAGEILYDGKIIVTGTGPFAVDTCIIEGPFINLVTDSSAVVSFETNQPIVVHVVADGRRFGNGEASTHHEIPLTGLQPDTEYKYTVAYDSYADTYSFRTAPKKGSRTRFTFGYASDGRGNNGGGERDIKGVNAYILKRIAALCAARGARFFQFTGDLIDGYTTNEGEIELEYANWKRAVEPYAHYIPFIAGFGNHEILMQQFRDGSHRLRIDRFPYETQSSEAVFARNFVNPHNGPVSEDGSAYDPDPSKTDFPPYDENAFYYIYDNIAMISLNSNYWYSPSVEHNPHIGGNLHGYVMDNQLAWLKTTLQMLEGDGDIDQVFVTIHTPILPNGGHTDDDMWYYGNNEPRPWVAGKPVANGIIERRDQLLDLLMNGSSKVVAVLAGDEHNYSVLHLTKDVPIYPDDYSRPRLTKFRPLWLITNGAAGAPYYGREETPWMDHVRVFSTQNALVLFHVEGEKTRVEVVNPDTLEPIDSFEL